MPDADTLKAAAKCTVVEPSVPLARVSMWALHHYEHGKPIGGSVARGDQIHEWLRDLEAAGFLIGFGWELRGETAPDDWPGWPIEPEPLLDPDCRDGKHGSCVGSPCECPCHRTTDGQDGGGTDG